MRTFLALIVKFVATFVAAWIAFGIVDTNPVSWILIVALAGTVLNYLVGDLVILPSTGNIIAAIGDGGLGAVTAYLIDLFTDYFSTSFMGLIVFAVIIMFAEYVFHIYLLKDEKVAPNDFHRESLE